MILRIVASAGAKSDTRSPCYAANSSTRRSHSSARRNLAEFFRRAER